jgi:mono/diheme cytochrome c family protein
MRKFYYGFGAAVLPGVLVLLGLFIYARFGFLDMRADIPVNAVEKAVAMPAVDASVDRRAPKVHDPVPSTQANLLAGMKMYQVNCASCHGDINRPHAMLADSLYPRPPQFMEDAPDMPPDQNFFILQHGIRWTGMPAWKQSLSDRQMWQLTTFLSQMDKLPPQVSAQWKAIARE